MPYGACNLEEFDNFKSECLKKCICNIINTVFLILNVITVACVITFNFIGNNIVELWKKCMELTGRKRIILDRESTDPYLERYYIFLKDRNSFPFNIFIHKFLKSDPDDLHDHPWGYITLILYGGYWEYYKNDNGLIVKQWCGPGKIQSRPANHTHRIELDKENPVCWTLFIPKKRQRDWGFYLNNNFANWVKEDKYLDEKKKD